MKKGKQTTGRKKKLFIVGIVAAIICTVACLVRCSASGCSVALWVDGLRMDILICEVLLLAEGYGLLGVIMLCSRDEKKNVAYGSR